MTHGDTWKLAQHSCFPGSLAFGSKGKKVSKTVYLIQFYKMGGGESTIYSPFGKENNMYAGIEMSRMSFNISTP